MTGPLGGSAESAADPHGAGKVYDELMEWADGPAGPNLMTVGYDGYVRAWELGLGLRNPPGWVLDLAEAVTGLRLDETAYPLQMPAAEVWERIRRAREEAARGDPKDPWVRWLRWFLADRDTRTLSPFSDVTPAQYRDLHPNPAPAPKTPAPPGAGP
ncbi:MAG: hypothetical protein KA419_08970 [Acidobacteria bacterium]|nr:hypothetical protein [Acidobacteriota bacterium]